MTPKEGEALLRELGNMAPSKSALDRLPKALSARWEANREAFESTLREVSMVPDEAVTVVMKDAQRAEKRERSRANEPACEGADAVSGGRLRDAARTGAKFTFRPSMGTALRYLSSRGDRPQQRGGVSSYASRVMDQYQSYTLSTKLKGRTAEGWVETVRTETKSSLSAGCVTDTGRYSYPRYRTHLRCRHPAPIAIGFDWSYVFLVDSRRIVANPMR